MSKLVIVESPAKARTIKNYLGKEYEVLASMGHIRDLPRSSMGVNLKKGFAPLYLTIDGKEKIIKQLREAAKKSDEVYLATDPDREGEAISWHLAKLLGLDEELSNRVIFGEITKNGVQRGMSEPRRIDRDLVDAQQARRVLDRIVGYKLSPFLWKKVRRGLSAGRVQSVAVRLIVDREREILAFTPEEYWQIDAVLRPEGSKKTFSARLRAVEGVAAEDFKIKDASECEKIVSELENEAFVIADVTERRRKRVPEPPFITSTLQQDASRRFGFTARRTMRAAQELYEGVAVEGHGTVGLITYMRTDSLRIAAEAHNEAVAYITGEYGAKYAVKAPRVFKGKRAVAAQDAHEAIRPTMVDVTPAAAAASLTADQSKLYRLIWERFIASRMADEILNTVTVNINAGKYRFRATGSEVVFDGFTKLYEASTDEGKEDGNMLPPLTKDTRLSKKEIKSSQHFTQPPARFSEASLIRALEENGIGRPSTYAPIISTIIERGYVERRQRAMIPTQLGMIVTDIMKEQFSEIVDVAFSAGLEKKLDTIEEGDADWVSVLDDFYRGFEASLERAEKNLEGKTIGVPDEVSDTVCELCGRNMVYKTGRFGRFLACPGYPECKNTKRIMEETKGLCPKCGGKIIRRRSPKGRVYYGCEKGRECGFMTWNEPAAELCPNCSGTLFLKKGKYPYMFCQKEGCGFRKDAER